MLTITRHDSVHSDFGALQIIYLLTYLLITTTTTTATILLLMLLQVKGKAICIALRVHTQ